MAVLEITDMNMKGAGVARMDGAVVFIPGGVDGDVCQVKIDGGGKNFLCGQLDALLTPSEHRCDPGCQVYGECGGCSLRHISYEHELQVKARSVEQAFRKNGIAVAVDTIRGTSPEGYRNKAVFHNGDGRLAYYSAQSRTPVYPREGGCALLPREFEEVRSFCEEYFAEEGFSLGLRIGDDSSVAVTVICDPGDALRDELRSFAETLTEQFDFISSVYGAYGDVNSPKCRFERITGEELLRATVCGVTFVVSPSAFFQVNPEGTALLCGEVSEMLDPRDGGRYADLYCGGGMFALTLAKRCAGAGFCGIEINPAAIRSAKETARANGIGNVRFYAGDAAAFPRELEGLDGLVVDPPRAGLSKKARELILQYLPERVVYVSCNPETLTRDCAALREQYGISAVRCVDMFPRTGHVETVALLSRQKGRGTYLL